MKNEKVKSKISKKPPAKIPRKSDDVLVTKRMLFGVRNELIEKISASKSELKSEIYKFRSELKSDISVLRTELKSDISKVQSDVLSLRGDIHKMQGDIHRISAEVHRVAVLVEEQNARNKPVLDSLLSIMERQERLEQEQKETRALIIK